MDARAHWESIYQRRQPDEVSWFQREATLSLRLIRENTSTSERVLDVGGGASTLVDGLMASGYRSVSVLDLSQSALDRARSRMGPEAPKVKWIHADILVVELPRHSVDVWHDRAVFHFLVEAESRERYISQVKRTIRPHGLVLMATFADDGPTQCSGLPVQRYSPEQLHSALGAEFVLVSSHYELHVTPQGATQSFVYCVCRHEPASSDRSVARVTT
ncbi:MAG TPA: class I SAM-dependent methyltransferase [Gemmatimonadaceae bacterium]